MKGRSIEDQDVDVPKTATPYAFPLAVLVNAKTASAAEILSGALQDHDRAVILGEPSFGKGLVQNVFPLSGNTAIALTTAFYYTPSGRSIQKPLPSGQLEIEKQKEQFQTDSGRSCDRRWRHSARRCDRAGTGHALADGAGCQRHHHVLRHRLHPEAPHSRTSR